MDDKEFDIIMRKYVSSTAKGMEEDFLKLNNQGQKESVSHKKSYKMFAWVSVTISVAIALVLAITLPLLYNTDKSSNDKKITSTIQYFESSTLDLIAVEEISLLDEQYNIDALLPTISYQEITIKALQPKESLVLAGVYLNYAIYDEIFDTLDLYIIPKNNVLDTLTHYENLSQETMWKDITVKYFITYNEYDGSYMNEIYFQKHDYKYYFSIVYYENLNTSEILDKIYL